MYTKESPEVLLATGKIEEYLKSFNTIDEVINDFSSYKTINYQLGIAIINTILNHITPERFSLFNRVISIKYIKGGMFDNEYYSPHISVETYRGVFEIRSKSWRDPENNNHDLDELIWCISEDKELMIHSLINFIKQLMNPPIEIHDESVNHSLTDFIVI